MTLDPYLMKQVEMGMDGADILHGHLKTLMYEAEQILNACIEVEEENDYSDAMESMDRKYAEGLLDAYSLLYKLTYDLSFAIGERK